MDKPNKNEVKDIVDFTEYCLVGELGEYNSQKDICDYINEEMIPESEQPDKYI